MVGLATTAGSTCFCPAWGTVPTVALDDQGRVSTDEWMSPEAAQLAAQQLALMAVPNCTDTCNYFQPIDHVIDHVINGNRHHESYIYNSRCDDGGLGATRRHCPLGSDTADCGCRNGTTVADWVSSQPLLGKQEDLWGERAGHNGCWAKGNELVDMGIHRTVLPRTSPRQRRLNARHRRSRRRQASRLQLLSLVLSW